LYAHGIQTLRIEASPQQHNFGPDLNTKPELKMKLNQEKMQKDTKRKQKRCFVRLHGLAPLPMPWAVGLWLLEIEGEAL
jgi:hypothetical protein